MGELDPLFFLSPGVVQKHWILDVCNSKRHVVTRFSAHGFHHFLCKNREGHEACDDCVCRFCNAKFVVLHGLFCSAFSSLSDLVRKCDAERELRG